jgi:transglutaminase-like putative cysteine protease
VSGGLNVRGVVEDFLRASEVIDFDHPHVSRQARELASGATEVGDVARRAFGWVRDEVRHSFDYKANPVTCRASEVLEHRTGYCYAKSHLLAALLRANGIPAGLCYQRLSRDDNGPPYTLHGFNAVPLPGHGWYRVDPRGNRPGVDAQFTPPHERLAFPIQFPGEVTYDDVWAEPLPSVVRALRSHETYDALWQNLPDSITG